MVPALNLTPPKNGRASLVEFAMRCCHSLSNRRLQFGGQKLVALKGLFSHGKIKFPEVYLPYPILSEVQSINSTEENRAEQYSVNNGKERASLTQLIHYVWCLTIWALFMPDKLWGSARRATQSTSYYCSSFVKLSLFRSVRPRSQSLTWGRKRRRGLLIRRGESSLVDCAQQNGDDDLEWRRQFSSGQGLVEIRSQGRNSICCGGSTRRVLN